MTWHAKAMQTQYITPPGAGSKGELEDESGVSVTDDLLVFPRRRGHEAPPEDAARRGPRRFHHGWHGLDPERRRPVARCARSAA